MRLRILTPAGHFGSRPPLDIIATVQWGAAETTRGVVVQRFVRGMALATAIGYVVLLVLAWVLNAPAGYDGILRPAPHEVGQGPTHELSPGGGFTVLEVEPGSPADRADIRPGDVISGLDGLSLSIMPDMHQAYHNRRAGQAASAKVGPFGTGRNATFTLESRLASPSITLGLAVASLLGMATVSIGAAVAFFRPRVRAAWLLLGFALALAISTAGDLWHWTQSYAWNAVLLDWLTGAIFTIGCAALLHLFLIFPTPNAMYIRLRRGIWLIYVLALVSVPLGLAFDFSGGPAIFSSLIMVGLLLAALVAGELSYRRPATALARAQLGWVRWGLGVGVVATVLNRVASLLVPEAIPAAVSTVVAAAWLAFPISLAFAILRYRLFEVDRIVRTSIVWGSLATVLLASYLVLVVVLSHLAVSVLGPGIGRDPTAAVLAALVVAVMVHPLRLRLQTALNRYIYRQRFARMKLLELATEVMARPQPNNALVTFACQRVPRALGIGGSWLAVPSDRATIFQGDDGVLVPNVSLASSVLVEALRNLRAPALLAPPDDLLAYGGMPSVSVVVPATAAWYAAGARAVVPVRGSSGELLALWALCSLNSGDLFEQEDLDVLERIAALAGMQLEREALLGSAQVAGRRAVSVESIEVLTARENEVLALLARGYSNRQIADELVIGVRTAETHVERVLRKLDLENRTQAVTWARDHHVEVTPTSP